MKFFVETIGVDEDSRFAGKHLVCQNEECGPGMEEALRVAAFSKEKDAELVCDALNQAYNDVMQQHQLTEFEPEEETVEEDV